MKNKVKILVLWALTALTGCSTSDESPQVAPEISYDQEISAAFFREGSSSAPAVNWNGDVGQFGLESAVKDVSIDKSTGIISWTKALSLGDHPITVLSYNNAGTTSHKINLVNTFQGNFEGTRSYSGEEIPVQLTYAPDGSCIMQYDGSSPMEGTWTFEDNEIKSRNENEEYIYYVWGSLTRSPKNVTMDGTFGSFAQGATKGIITSFHMNILIED